MTSWFHILYSNCSTGFGREGYGRNWKESDGSPCSHWEHSTGGRWPSHGGSPSETKTRSREGRRRIRSQTGQKRIHSVTTIVIKGLCPLLFLFSFCKAGWEATGGAEPSPPGSTERRPSTKPKNIILRKMAFANRSLSLSFQQRRISDSDVY